MKKLLLALALLFGLPSAASAQCNGTFANNTVCGNATGSANLPRPTNPSAFLGAVGGTNGQVQYNNSGALGGFTASGDATINTGTGVVTLSNSGVTPGSYGSATSVPVLTLDAKGRVTAASTTTTGVAEIWFASYAPTGDCVADDTTPFLNLISAINAQTSYDVVVRMGKGCYNINSATMGTPLITRSRVTIEGDGATITVTGTTVTAAVISTQGRSFIKYRNLNFVGNNQANAYANGVAISFTSDDTHGSAQNLTVENCNFQNFKGDYWVYVESLGLTSTLQDIFIRNNVFTSLTGNARGPANVAINSAAVAVINTNTNLNYPVVNVFVTGNTCYCDYIKTGVQIFDGIQNFYVKNNTIINAGQQQVSNDSGAYAILVYQNNGVNNGSRGVVSGNQIFSPRSIGIYQAGQWSGTIYSSNVIINQSPDTVAATLPKGGIVLNGGFRNLVTGNIISQTTRDAIWWSPGAVANSEISIIGNRIDTANNGVVVQSAVNSSANATVADNHITDVAGAGVSVQTFTTATMQGLAIVGNVINPLNAGTFGINVVSPDASYKLNTSIISGNRVIATRNSPTGIAMNNFVGANSIIKDNTFIGTFTATVTTTGSTGITTTNN